MDLHDAIQRSAAPMSFMRHQEIFSSDGGVGPTANAPAHRLDELPTGYSLVHLLSNIARLRFTSRRPLCSIGFLPVEIFSFNGK